MLFYTESNTPLGYGEFAFGFCEKSEEGKLKFFSLPQLLTDENLNSTLGYRKDFQLYFTQFADTNYILPKLNKLTDYNEDEVLTLDGSFTFEEIHSRQEDNQFIDKLINLIDKSLLPGFADYKDEFISLVNDAQECLQNIANNSFYYLIKDAPDDAWNDICNYNAMTSGKPINYTKLKQDDNSEKIMDSFDSELSLRIPTIKYVPKAFSNISVADDADYSDDSDVDDDFQTEILNNAYYTYLSDFNDSVFRQIDCIRPFGIPASFINASNYRDKNLVVEENGRETIKIVEGTLSKFSERLIQGDSKNDKLDLQPNEEKFYNRLIKMIDTWFSKYQLQDNLPEIVISKSKDECIIRDELKDLLNTFIWFALNINWRFNSYVPLNHLAGFTPEKTDSDGEESNDSTENDNLAIGGVFEYALDDSQAIDDENSIDMGFSISAVDAIYSLITNSGANVYAYAEVIIKLLRWGEIKPHNLCITFPQSYTNKPKSTTSLSLSNLHIQKEEIAEETVVISDEGYDTELFGTIYTADTDMDSTEDVGEGRILSQLNLQKCEYIPKTLLGFILIQKISNGNPEDNFKRSLFVDLRTFIHLVTNNIYKIKGVEYANGTFTFTTDDDVLKANELTAFDMTRLDPTQGRYQQRINFNEEIVKAHPDLTLRQVNTCNYLDVFNEMNLSGIIDFRGIFINKDLAAAHLNLAAELYTYIHMMEDKTDPSTQEAFNTYLKALNSFTADTAEAAQQQPAPTSQKTNQFTESEISAQKVQITHILSFEDLVMMKASDNYVLVNPAVPTDTTAAKKISGNSALIKILSFAIDKGVKSGINISDEDVEKVKQFTQKRFNSDNLVLVYTNIHNQLKKG